MKKSTLNADKSCLVFTGYLFQEKKGFSALCPEVDVASEGNSQLEAKNNLVEAVELYIETAVENNLPILRPVPPCDNPAINRANDIFESFPMNVNLEVSIHA